MAVGGDRNEQLVAGYRRDQIRRGLAPGTVESRSRSLRMFGRWLGGDMLKADRHAVEKFLDSRNLGARARYRWISDLHNFYSWAIAEETPGAHDPTLRVTRPRLKPLLPRPIGDGNLDMALQMADRKMRAMLLTAHLAGARCVEISRLDREDVLDTYDPPILVLHGKGDKDRVVPLHDDLSAALDALPLPRSGRVFRTARGRPMTAQLVSSDINTFLHSIGINETAHTLRHWFGTHFYQATRDLRATQEVLGHASPTTTAIYTKWSVADSVEGVQGLRSPGGCHTRSQ